MSIANNSTHSKKLLHLIQHNINNQVESCVSSRELYLGLGLLESKWARWSATNIENNEFFLKGNDWVPLASLPPKGSRKGRFANDYLVTLRFAQHLAMMAKTKRAHDYRDYLLNCEKQLIQQERHKTDFERIEARTKGKEIRGVLGKAIDSYSQLANAQSNEVKDRHYYSLFTSETYKQLFCDRKIKKIRDGKLDALQLQMLAVCEAALTDELNTLVEANTEYHEIYQICKKRIAETVDALSKTRLKSYGASDIRLSWETKEPKTPYLVQQVAQ
jgi:phage anti-repressor protein